MKLDAYRSERKRKEGGRKGKGKGKREEKEEKGRKVEGKRKGREGTQRETPPSPTVEDPSPVLSIEEGFSREN